MIASARSSDRWRLLTAHQAQTRPPPLTHIPFTPLHTNRQPCGLHSCGRRPRQLRSQRGDGAGGCCCEDEEEQCCHHRHHRLPHQPQHSQQHRQPQVPAALSPHRASSSNDALSRAAAPRARRTAAGACLCGVTPSSLPAFIPTPRVLICRPQQHRLHSSGQVVNEAIRTDRVRLVIKDEATGGSVSHP